MSKKYEAEFKKEIVRLHLEQGKTIKYLSEEYNVAKSTITAWVKNFSEECQTNERASLEYDYMKENRRLHKLLAEKEKENEFLKKAAAFFAKEID